MEFEDRYRIEQAGMLPVARARIEDIISRGPRFIHQYMHGNTTVETGFDADAAAGQVYETLRNTAPAAHKVEINKQGHVALTMPIPTEYLGARASRAQICFGKHTGSVQLDGEVIKSVMPAIGIETEDPEVRFAINRTGWDCLVTDGVRRAINRVQVRHARERYPLLSTGLSDAHVQRWLVDKESRRIQPDEWRALTRPMQALAQVSTGLDRHLTA